MTITRAIISYSASSIGARAQKNAVKPSSLRVRPAMHKRRLPVELELTWGFAVFYLGKVTNVGKTIINHPPVITIFIGGIFSIPSHGW